MRTMNKFRDKLKNQSGASMIIALLFFLLCAMIGSSVLMASASNMGKSRSNEEQHQTYLALSSAVRLICDDIANSTYTGKYTYTVTTTGEGDDKKTTTSLTQQDGTYSGKLSDMILSALDGMTGTGIKNKFETQVNSLNVKNETATDFKFKVQPQDVQIQEGETIKIGDVDMELKIETSYSIYIKATVKNDGEDGDYVVYAELTPKDNTDISDSLNEGSNTHTINWELGYITTQDNGEFNEA